MKDSKRELMLHEVGPVARFERLGKRVALEHPAVYKKDLEISGGPADLRSSDKALQAVMSVKESSLRHLR